MSASCPFSAGGKSRPCAALARTVAVGDRHAGALGRNKADRELAERARGQPPTLINSAARGAQRKAGLAPLDCRPSAPKRSSVQRLYLHEPMVVIAADPER